MNAAPEEKKKRIEGMSPIRLKKQKERMTVEPEKGSEKGNALTQAALFVFGWLLLFVDFSEGQIVSQVG